MIERKTQMFESTAICGTIYIGKRGENKARRIRFDEPTQWQDIFGVGTYELLHQRNGDNAPYPVVLSIEDGAVYWVVSASDTAIEGEGKCELRYIVNDTVVKSQTWKTVVAEGLGEASSEAPEPQKEWVDRVLETGIMVENATSSAISSAKQASESAQSASGSATDAQIAAESIKKAHSEIETAKAKVDATIKAHKEETDNAIAEHKAEVDNTITENEAKANKIFSNVLNGNVTAVNVLRIDDVSPNEHTMGVKVRSKNIFNLESPLTKHTATKHDWSSLSANSLKVELKPEQKRSYAEIAVNDYNDLIQSLDGESITLSVKGLRPGDTISLGVKYWGNDYSLTSSATSSVKNICTHTFNHQGRKVQYLVVRPFRDGGGKSDTVITLNDIQLEWGNKATPYAPYVDVSGVQIKVGADEGVKTTYKPNADGTVEGVTSLSPITTLISDKDGVVIEAEYNKDLNKAFNEVINRLTAIEEAII